MRGENDVTFDDTLYTEADPKNFSGRFGSSEGCKILSNFTFMKKLFLMKDRYCGSFHQEQVFPKYGLHKLVFEQ